MDFAPHFVRVYKKTMEQGVVKKQESESFVIEVGYSIKAQTTASTIITFYTRERPIIDRRPSQTTPEYIHTYIQIYIRVYRSLTFNV
jgi:hypothetical protein